MKRSENMTAAEWRLLRDLSEKGSYVKLYYKTGIVRPSDRAAYRATIESLADRGLIEPCLSIGFLGILALRDKYPKETFSR